MNKLAFVVGTASFLRALALAERDVGEIHQHLQRTRAVQRMQLGGPEVICIRAVRFTVDVELHVLRMVSIYLCARNVLTVRGHERLTL